MGLRYENVSIALAGRPIVREVSLLVEDRQFVGLLGPNGCGKSTLLRSLYKAVRPQNGAIVLNTLDVLKSNPKAIARQMSVVSQFNSTGFDMSVRQFVLAGRSPHKGLLEKDSERDFEIVRRALRTVDMESFADRSYSTLSGGEKQRVVLARAIAQEPGFIALDEPTNHLDIKYQLSILSAVKSLQIGVLAALHDLNLAAMYCTYIYLMNAGHIVAKGTPHEVLTEENITAVYEVRCQVSKDPEQGNLHITYLV